MAKINVLRKEISELIAAGEVIERPSSVIKELVENSIDAGAKHIVVEIKHGGTTFMRITDDGCGMAQEDVPTAFLRHATSKINDKNDLDNIFTLGFRGEALASVSAVAKVSVLTKRPEDVMGTSFEIQGSVPGACVESGCPDGTTIIIRDLFYNVPVRQKFMKKDVAEGNAISHIMQKIALSHPEISFRMIRDNRMEFRTDGNGSLYAAIYSILGKDFARDLIPVEYTDGVRSVSGFIGKPLYAKANRTFQNFFINGRYVRSRSCSTALESAFQNLVMVGKFPCCVLSVQMPPEQLDVNIHPAKAEVRFSDEKSVMDVVFFACKNALMQNGLIYEFQLDRLPKRDWTAQPTPKFDTLPVESEPTSVSEKIPQPSFSSQVEKQPELSTDYSTNGENPVENPVPVSNIPPVSQPAGVEESFHNSTPVVEKSVPEQTSPMESDLTDKYQFIHSDAFEKKPEPAPIPQVPAEPYKPKEPIRVMGEVFRNYIVAQAGEEMILIDKHAAHERVNFERLMSGSARDLSQMLLQKSETLVSMEEFTAMEEHEELLKSWGFLPDFSNPPMVSVTAIPSFMQDMNIDEIISEIAHNLFLGKQNPQTHMLADMLHDIACKSAIRAGDRNSIEELQVLAEEAWNNEAIRHCPHGRPVMFIIRKYDLEKQFRRIQ